MKQLVIIGAGGMGRTMYDIARECSGYGSEYEIKGFIDDNLNALDGFQNYPEIIGTISDYIPSEDDIFTCSIGGAVRIDCINHILKRGGKFRTLIHRTARIGSNVMIGEGTIVAAYTSIGADAIIGVHNLIQSYTIVAHDCRIGDFNRIDSHVTMIGGSRIEDKCEIYTNSVINNGAVCESGSRVTAMSFVISRVKAGTTVMGNPARKLKL